MYVRVYNFPPLAPSRKSLSSLSLPIGAIAACFLMQYPMNP
jgi:hypothetical protein